jgi:glucosylceramidase
MVLEPGGVSTWGWPQNSMIVVDRATRRWTLTPEYYVMKHFARFIEPGAVRLVLSGPWAGNAVAFSNPNGEVVLVVCNPLAQARAFRCSVLGRTVTAELGPQSFHTFVVNA